jgi:hypothetical protein
MCDYMWGNIRVFGDVYIYNLFNRGGQAYFFKSVNRKPDNSWAPSAISNSQISEGLPFRKSQIRKLLWLIRKSHTRTFLQILHNSVSKQLSPSVTFAESPQI